MFQSLVSAAHTLWKSNHCMPSLEFLFRASRVEPSAPPLQCLLPRTSPLERNLPAEIQFGDNGESFLFRNLHVKQEFMYVNRRNTCFCQMKYDENV